MKSRILIGVLLVLVVGLVAVGATFRPVKLEVPDKLDLSGHSSLHVEGVSVHAVKTGYITSREAFAYRGGSFLKERLFVSGAIYIRHPKGDLIIDAGMGRNVQEHAKTLPWALRVSQKVVGTKSLFDQMKGSGMDTGAVKGALITHAHWDHVSGLEHFQGVPVYFPKEELAFIKMGSALSILAKKLIGSNYKLYDFKDGAYLGFEASQDIYGDGSVVVVPAFGHTLGSVIVFVTTGDGKRYAFIGDLAWQKEGVDLPAEKPWLVRRRVDANAETTRKLLGRMHRLQKMMPELIVVPAHDMREWDKLPGLGVKAGH